MRRTTLALGLVLAVLAPGLTPAQAADDDALEREAKAQIAYFKKYAKKAKDDAKYAQMVFDLSGTEHPLAADYIGRILLKDKDLEHQMIAAATLAEFKNHPEGRAAAGDVMIKALEKGKYEVDVLDSIVNSLGKITYEPAVPALCEVLRKGGDPYLLVTTVRALGRIEDVKALPTMLELWERHPVGYSWETGEVSVDTGAPGTADQEAAEAAWHAKYGHMLGGKKSPPVMLKIYFQELAKAANRITIAYEKQDPSVPPLLDEEGERKPIGFASELRKWMEVRAKALRKLGIEIPRYKGPRQKDEDEKKKKKKH
jgi:hypothetical protein